MGKAFSSFSFLNSAQFLITLIDSVFRSVIAYSLIDLLGADKSNHIISISAALFVVPFLLFSMPAGQLADRYSKQRVLLWSLLAEVVVVGFAIFAVYTRGEYLGYFSLFLVGLQASVFNPSKYAILPEIEPASRLARVNGWMTFFTYLAIIFGTFLASFIADHTGRNYLLITCIAFVFSIMALLCGWGIEKTPVQNPKKRINPLFIVEIYKSLRLATKYPQLLMAILSSSYFLFTAAYTQLNLIPFGMQSLGITDVQTGYVFLLAAFGLGFGSLTVGVLSKKRINLLLTLWGAFGTATSYILLYFFQHSIIISCILFFFIGMHGGLFVVPLDAYMQFASPKKERGSIIAAASFLSFFAVLIAAGTLAFLGDYLKWKAVTGFLLIGCLTMVIAFWILLCLKRKG